MSKRANAVPTGIVWVACMISAFGIFSECRKQRNARFARLPGLAISSSASGLSSGLRKEVGGAGIPGMVKLPIQIEAVRAIIVVQSAELMYSFNTNLSMSLGPAWSAGLLLRFLLLRWLQTVPLIMLLKS
jgi:hypothetical protein